MWRGFGGGKHPCVATRAPVGCVRAPRRTVAEHALALTVYTFGWRLDMGSDNPGVPQSRILASARHQQVQIAPEPSANDSESRRAASADQDGRTVGCSEDTTSDADYDWPHSAMASAVHQ